MGQDYVVNFDVFPEHLSSVLGHVIGKPYVGAREAKIDGVWRPLQRPPDDSFVCVSAREVSGALPGMTRVEAIYRKKAD